MKKLFVILIMLFYGLSSSGMTVTLHYCCGKLDDISLLAKQKKSCPMGGKHFKNNSCCNETQLSAKISGEQQAAAKWIQASQTNVAIAFHDEPFANFTSHIVAVNRLARGTPVPISPVPLFIKYCVFRI